VTRGESFMNGCERIMSLIDQSHRPDVLPIEAEAHIDACESCRLFANERAALRDLLASSARVTVPENFDFVLKQKLAASSSPAAASWMTPAFYFRLAASAAAVVILAIIFVPRYFQAGKSGPVAIDRVEAPKPGADQVTPLPDIVHSPIGPSVTPVVLNGRNSSRGQSRARYTPPPPEEVYLGDDRTGTLLIRSDAGDVELPMRTVSYGSQSPFYGAEPRQSVRATPRTF